MLEINNLFNVIYADDNPFVLKTEEIYKQGDVIKKVNKVETFNLEYTDLIEKLKSTKNIKFFKYKQVGIKRLFFKYKTKLIEKELNEFYKKGNWIIMSDNVINSLNRSILLNKDILIDNRLDNDILIVSKSIRCIIHKSSDDYYLDIDDVLLFRLI